MAAGYIFRMTTHTPKEWETKGVAIGMLTITSLIVIFSTKWSLRLVNFLGTVKVLTLLL